MSRDTTDWNEEAEGEMEELRERAEENIVALRDWLSEVDARARSFVAERPIVSLVAAVGVGFLIGKLIGGRR